MARKQSLPKKPLSTGPDRDRKLSGANLAEVFRTPLYDCSLKNVSGVPDFALTRLKGGSMEMQRAPAYPEDRAMLICVALAPTPVDRWRARIAGQEACVSRSIAFATTVIDLMKPMEMWAAGPFDYLHYYVSRDLLDRVAADNRTAPVDSFRMVFFERDLVVAQLTIQPIFMTQLGLAIPPATSGATVSPTTPVPTITEPERKTAELTMQVIRQQFERLARSGDLRTADVQQRITSRVTELMQPVQGELPGMTHPVDVASVVDRVTSAIAERTIDIPKIIVTPKGEVRVTIMTTNCNTELAFPTGIVSDSFGKS